MQKYKSTTYEISELVTKEYSTSFYTASNLFDKEIKNHIFNIYGFVRFADEIVDTFHDYDKEKLLLKFEDDYYHAFESGISLNPILHSFQDTVKKYNISNEHVQAFLNSMKTDLNKTTFDNQQEINEYIYGSADVVGFMCLKVFCNGDETLYNETKPSAIKLGSAFQKVNFLRDLKNDIESLGRQYFPELVGKEFDENIKSKIIADIENDFNIALQGLKKLPNNSRLAVYTAYLYYTELLRKIKKTKAQKIMNQRIRVTNFKKLLLLIKAFMKYKLNLI